MIRIFCATALFFGAVFQTAQADQAAVKCVQRQLNNMAFDAGKEDGKLGLKTEIAFIKYQSSGEKPEFTFDLNHDNAIVICRELGLDSDIQRVNWPSFRKQFATDFHSSLSPDIRRALRASTKQAFQNLNEVFGIRLAGRANVLAGIRYPDLTNLVESTLRRDINREEFTAFLSTTCAKDRRISGFASLDYIAICFPQGNVEIKRDKTKGHATGTKNRALLDDVIFHEVVHFAQSQLSGYNGAANDVDRINFRGPEWLAEGVAQYLAMLVFNPDDNVDERMAWIKGKSAGPSGDLSIYNPYSIRETDQDNMYLQGLLASHVLAKRAGNNALLEFYRNLGFGMDWEDAFGVSFGIRPAQFYRIFAES